jgi:hypothetical protein
VKKPQLAEMMAGDICNSYLNTEESNKEEVIRALVGLGYVREDVVVCLPLAIELCLARGRPHAVYESSTTNSLSFFTRPCLYPLGHDGEPDPWKWGDDPDPAGAVQC